jgi:hypothetical protein
MDEIISVILLLFILGEEGINYIPGGAKFLNTSLVGRYPGCFFTVYACKHERCSHVPLRNIPNGNYMIIHVRRHQSASWILTTHRDRENLISVSTLDRWRIASRQSHLLERKVLQQKGLENPLVQPNSKDGLW